MVLINSVQWEAVANYFLHIAHETKAWNKRKERVQRELGKKLLVFDGLSKNEHGKTARKTVGRFLVLWQSSSLARRTGVVFEVERYLTFLNFWAPYWRRYMLFKTRCRRTSFPIILDKRLKEKRKARLFCHKCQGRQLCLKTSDRCARNIEDLRRRP